MIVSVVLVLIAAVAVTLITSLHSKGARPVVGEPIQDFTAVDSQGVTFTLSESTPRAGRLIFYRGFWWNLPEPAAGPRTDPPDLELWRRWWPFRRTARRWRSGRVDLGSATRHSRRPLKLLRLFDHAETYSNDDIFHPAVYVIDQEGIVRWGYFGDDAADRPPTDEVYRAVLELVRAADAGPTPAETES